MIGQIERPNVTGIHGLSPSVAIEQKTISRNPRSTVGTITDIYPYLRVLYAAVGRSDGGSSGGNVVACGTPEEVAADPASYTGAYLEQVI